MSKKRDYMREKKEFRASMDSACKLYNSNINQLTAIACHKNPDDDNIAKIRDALRAVLVADETMVIIQSGTYIWKYREEIANKDETFFLANKFEDDIANVKQNQAIKEKNFSDDEIAAVMNSIKSTYTTMKAPEKETIWRHVMELLRSYAQYLGAERKLLLLEQELKQLAKS
jgi:hypothetical protein